MQSERPTTPPPPPPQRRKTKEEILAQVELANAELRRYEELEAAEERALLTTADGAEVLVQGSPSPPWRKGEERERGYDSTMGPPPPYVNPSLLRRASTKSAEEFVAQQTTLPPSKFGAGLEKVAQRSKVDEFRRAEIIVKRSTSFEKRAEPVKEERATKKEKPIAGSSRDSTRGSTRASGSGAQPAPQYTNPRETVASLIKKKKRKSSASDDDEDAELDILDGPTEPPARRSDGTIIERVEQGPVHHRSIPGDPNFDTIEPNSGIRLRKGSRLISHSTLQDYLTDRYHLSPSLLYSFTRNSRAGSTAGALEVDLVGDFVIIAVLAQKGPPRFIKNPNTGSEAVKEERKNKWSKVNGLEGVGDEDEEDAMKVEGEGDDEQGGGDAWAKKKRKKNLRYIQCTLVDLSTVQSEAAGTGTIKMMLFEANEKTTMIEEDGYEVPRYKGGSGGAYEKFWKEAEGAVVAILNPKVMRSQPVLGKPNIITITPESAESMMVIGKALDLSSCQAVRMDGAVCGEWCDARVNKICAFHVSRAVKGTGASRPETYSSNSSLSNTTTFNPKKFSAGFQPRSNKPSYDAATKTGLLPRDNISMVEGSKTYVVAGSGPPPSQLKRGGGNKILTSAGLRSAAIQSGNGSGGFIHGVRDGPTVEEALKERKMLKLAKERREVELRELMERDEGRSLGGVYVKLAKGKREEEEREFRKKNGMEVKGDKEEERKEKEKESRRKRTSGAEEKGEREDEDEDEDVKPEGRTKNGAFSTKAVRLIGFLPTSNEIPREEDDETRRKRLAAISSLSKGTDRPVIKLTAPPGPKVRSGVVVPPAAKKAKVEVERDDTEDDEDDLEVQGAPSEMPPRRVVLKAEHAARAGSMSMDED